jgi:putative hydrolase of the HAD superfamily
MLHSTPKAILFDLDDTLITHKEALEAALAFIYPAYPELAKFYSYPTFVAAWKESLNSYYQNLTTEPLSERERRINRIAKIWKPVHDNPSPEFCLAVIANYLKAYEKNWRPHDDVIPSLTHLSHLPMGIVTNGHVQQQNQKLRVCGLDRFFKTVVTSEEAGVGKPQPAIFHLACQRLGVDPRNVIYVGDLIETDALGASNAGLIGVWINREGIQDERAASVATISRLSELETLELLPTGRYCYV